MPPAFHPSEIPFRYSRISPAACSANWAEPLQHPQEAIPSLHTSPALHPLKEGDFYPISPHSCLYFFECPHVCESVHLDRRYFNRSKDMQKMYLAHKPTCSHVEGMFLQLTFQPDFLGQFLERLTPPRTHTHVHTHTVTHTQTDTLLVFTPTQVVRLHIFTSMAGIYVPITDM